MSEVLSVAQTTIENGSKSFSFAGKFFPRDQWQAACLIYFWCRYCDDQIDEGGDQLKLLNLELKTKAIWEDGAHLELPFLALKEAATRFHIPSTYPLELLSGMAMDIEGMSYQTVSDLHLYCYRVASTVGLMMSHVMGIFNVEALKEAAHLGMAMQMTNIARDIKEDYLRGRCYLPSEWLANEGINSKNMWEIENRAKLWQVELKLLAEAETYYDSGLSGIKFLPLRSALTILIAGKIYRQIGRQNKKLGLASLEIRVSVPLWKKVFLALSAIGEIALSLPYRMISRHEKVLIDRVWRMT
jgi:phytoene synthase